MTISPPKIRIFPFFLSVMSTDKPVNGSKHAYAVTQLKVLAFRGFFLFHDILKSKKRKEFEKIGLHNTKNMWRENVLPHAHL